MSFSYDGLIHLVAGGVGGTVGAIVTCPLEVVKTRQQSSLSTFHPGVLPSQPQQPVGAPRNGLVLWNCIKHIVATEGPRALFKGLAPNLIGVAPSRAIYFSTYSTVKNFCNENFTTPDAPPVHICSAAAAGIVSSTMTNPIWFVKTRLQLDQSQYGSTTAWQCMRTIYRESGLIGFYKGITASYFGISETIIHFVLYEFIKSKLRERRLSAQVDKEVEIADGYSVQFGQFMMAGATSKTIASVIAYPHEVARTRLRQEGNKYTGFVQTIKLVWHEEGNRGLYRGLGTQLVRQIPNTAIMMATYELIVYLLTSFERTRNTL